MSLSTDGGVCTVQVGMVANNRDCLFVCLFVVVVAFFLGGGGLHIKDF